MSEFSLIKEFFSPQLKNTTINKLGVGDDCALMSVPDGYELAITTDTMVEGVHFFAGEDPKQLGHKLLAVNLSDLAAMGADPVSVTLSLTLPEVDYGWVKMFSEGFLNLANQFSVDLIGGDISSGPLVLTVQALGLIPKGQALLRSTAKVGDLIFVTGFLGEAGLGLKVEKGYRCPSPVKVLKQFHLPMPRVTESLIIKAFASACIDLSDGIASDLKHILEKSSVGASLYWDKLPLSKEVIEYIELTDDWLMPLTAGDDYELCFTVSPDKIDLVQLDCTQVGVIEAEGGLRIHRFGLTEELKVKGFEHFS